MLTAVHKGVLSSLSVFISKWPSSSIRVVVRIFNRQKNTCNRRQALEAACGFGSCVSSFQDSSAGNFLGTAGDFFPEYSG